MNAHLGAPMRIGVPSGLMDAGNVVAPPLADDSLLDALKFRHGRQWRIWPARDEWHAHRIGDFHQESWPGAPRYAVHAPKLIELAEALEDETQRDAAGGIDRTAVRSEL